MNGTATARATEPQTSLVPDAYRRAPQFCTNIADMNHDAPLKVSKAATQHLLSLPEYQSMDIHDLFAVARMKLGKIRGISISSRAMAIAIIRGAR